MKKFISISLLFFYLFTTAGFTVYAHYCGGSLASLALVEGDECCCDSGKQEPKGCCKSEVKSIRLTADQLKTEFSPAPVHSWDVDEALQVISYPALSFFDTDTNVPVASVVPDPPVRRAGVPIYLLHHSFLIYC